MYCLIALMQKIASIRLCLIDNSKYSTIKFDGELLRYRPKSQMRTYERKTRNAQIAATCRSVFRFLLLESEHSSRLCIALGCAYSYLYYWKIFALLSCCFSRSFSEKYFKKL